MEPLIRKIHSSFKLVLLNPFEPEILSNRTITEYENSAYLVGVEYNNFTTQCFRFSIEEKKWAPVVSFPKIRTSVTLDCISLSVALYQDSLIVLAQNCFFKYNIKTRKTLKLELHEEFKNEFFVSSIVRNDSLISYSKTGNIFKFDLKLKIWSEIVFKGKIKLVRWNHSHCYDIDSSKWVNFLIPLM
jgi:hypothetical protein